jgi:hypothetical protein
VKEPAVSDGAMEGAERLEGTSAENSGFAGQSKL